MEPYKTFKQLSTELSHILTQSVTVLHTHAHPSYSLNHFLGFQCTWQCQACARCMGG